MRASPSHAKVDSNFTDALLTLGVGGGVGVGVGIRSRLHFRLACLCQEEEQEGRYISSRMEAQWVIF